MPGSARLILLGDKDQLAAVESGAVFAELSADPQLSIACRQALAEMCGVPEELITPGAALEASPLRDSVVWFTRNYRFAAGSGIALAADDIRLGRAGEFITRLRQEADASVHWLDDAGVSPGAATLHCMAEGYAPYLDVVQRDPADVAARRPGLRTLSCPLRAARGPAWRECDQRAVVALGALVAGTTARRERAR